MDSQHKVFTQNLDDDEPFKIVHNARKNSRHLRSTGMKSRKNSTISLVDQKQKRIKKKQRKLTQCLNQGQKWQDEQKQYSQRMSSKHSDPMEDPLLVYMQQNGYMQQKIKYEKEQLVFSQKQGEEFYFTDRQVQKGILEGIGDENSLGRQFGFDFFNPENYRK